jgi:hypothetical protein
MSLIFDRFPTTAQASSVVDVVRTRFGVDGQVFTDPDDAMNHDPFPLDLDPSIVNID